MTKIKVKILKEVEIEVPTFDEFDRTDLVIGVGKIYGRDGTYPRTDLGRWLFQAPGFVVNLFLESDGRLTCSNQPDITCKTLINAIENDGKIIYQKLVKEKYEPLFHKYNLKGFEDVISLNLSQQGLENWLKSRWIPGEIVTRPDNNGIQNGNLGMFAHQWEYENTQNYKIDYYIDFSGKIFEPNLYAGSQSPEELKRWGKKISTPKIYKFKTKTEKEISVIDSYERFKKGELLGFAESSIWY